MFNHNNGAVFSNKITIADFLNLFKKYWREFFLTSSLGIIASIIYLWLTPNQYQATFYVQMAQISHPSPSGRTIINAEDPNILITRMKIPSYYSDKQIQVCGLENSQKPYEDLVAAIKSSIPKNATSIIELKVFGNSKSDLITCSESIFEGIKKSQDNIVDNHLDNENNLLNINIDRLNYLRGLMSKSTDSSHSTSAFYLLTHNEYISLEQEVLRLKENIRANEAMRTRLLSPIYVFSKPVAPDIKGVILIGVMAGIFAGFFLVMIKKSRMIN